MKEGLPPSPGGVNEGGRHTNDIVGEECTKAEEGSNEKQEEEKNANEEDKE